MFAKRMRFRLFGVVTTLAAITAVVCLSLPVPKARGVAKDLTVDVLLDNAGTFNLVAAPLGGGPFHIQGLIFPAGTFAAEGCPPDVDPIGDYDCWGVLAPLASDGPGHVSQEYNLFNRGKIQVQGQEGPTSIIAVVGGTGDFKYAQGEGTRRDQFVCTESPENRVAFTIDFDMIGVGH